MRSQLSKVDDRERLEELSREYLRILSEERNLTARKRKVRDAATALLGHIGQMELLFDDGPDWKVKAMRYDVMKPIFDMFKFTERLRSIGIDPQPFIVETLDRDALLEAINDGKVGLDQLQGTYREEKVSYFRVDRIKTAIPQEGEEV